LSQPNTVKNYTFFCKSQVEKQTWMAELASMVLQLPPPSNINPAASSSTTGGGANNKGFGTAGSFIKSATFQASRPPGQTSMANSVIHSSIIIHSFNQSIIHSPTIIHSFTNHHSFINHFHFHLIAHHSTVKKYAINLPATERK